MRYDKIKNYMLNNKSIGAIVFYIFIIIFVVLAYLNNKGSLVYLFPKKTTIISKNVVQIEYKDKEYGVDYTKKFKDNATEISNFEEEEKWNGDYKIDNSNYWEGQSSYVIFAKGLKSTTLTLNKSVNLLDSEMIKILIYSADQKNIDHIKKATLRFGNLTDTTYYEYDMRNIKTGWNIITMKKNDFSFEGVKKISEDNLWLNIEKITLRIDSLPSGQVEISVDRLWAEKNKNSDYKKEFFTTSTDMMSLKSFNKNSYINFWGIGSNLSLVNKINGVKNFTYTAKIIPQKIGTFGINARTDLATAYGYYLSLDGIGTNTWQFYKIGKTGNTGTITKLDNGSISNFQFEPNQPVWLRIKTSGNTITGYISTDEKNFVKLTEKNDDEHKSGGIGVQTINASFLLESIDFKQ